MSPRTVASGQQQLPHLGGIAQHEVARSGLRPPVPARQGELGPDLRGTVPVVGTCERSMPSARNGAINASSESTSVPSKSNTAMVRSPLTSGRAG